MKRSELISSREFWINEIQNNLYGAIESYMSQKKMSRTELADQLKVTKGYISQVLNGDFDHKVSKMVDLSLACDLIPMVFFIKKNDFIENDRLDKTYELVPMMRGKSMRYENQKLDSRQPAKIYIGEVPAKQRMTEIRPMNPTLVEQKASQKDLPELALFAPVEI